MRRQGSRRTTAMRPMHFFWGDSPMSWLRYMTLKTFRAFNPSTEMVLHVAPFEHRGTWTTSEADEAYEGYDWRPEIAALNVRVEPYAPPAGLPPQQACDLCRWEVLAAGGIFSDMDIIWLAPLPELVGDAVSCDNGILKMGVMSGAPGGLFVRVHELALQRLDPGSYQSIGVKVLYELALGRQIGDVKLARGQNTLEGLGAESIPMRWVHPLNPHRIADSKCPRYCIGLHWYGGLESSAQVSREMTPENWRSFGGAIPDALLKCLGRGVIQ